MKKSIVIYINRHHTRIWSDWWNYTNSKIQCEKEAKNISLRELSVVSCLQFAHFRFPSPIFPTKLTLLSFFSKKDFPYFPLGNTMKDLLFIHWMFAYAFTVIILQERFLQLQKSPTARFCKWRVILIKIEDNFQ